MGTTAVEGDERSTLVLPVKDRAVPDLLLKAALSVLYLAQAAYRGDAWIIAFSVVVVVVFLASAVHKWRKGSPAVTAIGPDGLTIEYRRGRPTQSWRWTEVERVSQPMRREVTLRLRDGEAVVVPLGRRERSYDETEAIVDVIVERAVAAGAMTAPKLSDRIRRRQRHNIPDGY